MPTPNSTASVHLTHWPDVFRLWAQRWWDAAISDLRDERLRAWLVLEHASIPDASGPPRHPGVPEGAVFLPVVPRLKPEEVARALLVPEYEGAR